MSWHGNTSHITGSLWGESHVSRLDPPDKKSVMQNLTFCFVSLNKLLGKWWSCWQFNSLGPSDAIWRQRSGSTLVHVMACCLTAPSHYLNHWSLRSSDVHLRAILIEISQPSATKMSLKIIFLRFYWNLPGANELRCHDSHVTWLWWLCVCFRLVQIYDVSTYQVVHTLDYPSPILSLGIAVSIKHMVILNMALHFVDWTNGCHFAHSIFTCIPVTHWGRDKMGAILADNIFKWIFLNENGRIQIQISLKFVFSPIDNRPALVQIMTWH